MTALDISGASNRAAVRAEQGRQLSTKSVLELQFRGQTLARFRWGRADVFGQPAYWAHQVRSEQWRAETLRGNSLVEEVCYCLLGGHGVTAEVNFAAFVSLSQSGVVSLDRRPSAREVEDVLRRPLTVPGRPRPIHYRFPRQRAERIAAALQFLGREPLPTDHIALRDTLLGVVGIGPKTASWIVRNAFDSDTVAIIDVHLIRCGIAAGFFDPAWSLQRHYDLFEAAFLGFADCCEAKAGDLDLCMWSQVRQLGNFASRLLRPPSEIP